MQSLLIYLIDLVQLFNVYGRFALEPFATIFYKCAGEVAYHVFWFSADAISLW